MSLCEQPILSSLCQTADETAAAMAAAPLQWVADSVGQTAGWFVEGLWLVFDSTTMVDVTSPGFLAVYNLIFGIGILVALLLFCFQLITAMVKREPGGLTRAGIGLGKSVLGSFVAVTLVALGLEIIDQLSIGIVQATGNTMAGMGDKILILITSLNTLNVVSPGIGAIVTLFLGGLAIAATAIVWLSLLVRKSLILLAVALAPLALAGSSWDTTRGWASKWLMFLVALVASKLVLTVILLIAISQISTPIALDIQALTDPLAGIVLLLVAAFAPYVTYKAISFLGTDYYHAMSTESEAKNALNRPVPVPNRIPGNPFDLFGKKGGGDDGGNSGGGDSPAPPTPSGGAPTDGGAPAGEGETVAAEGGEGAAGGPVVLAVTTGVAVGKKSMEAGPELGEYMGGQADVQMSGAGGTGQSPSPPSAPPQRSPQVPPPRPLPPGQSSDPAPTSPEK